MRRLCRSSLRAVASRGSRPPPRPLRLVLAPARHFSTASASWQGSLAEGEGTVTSEGLSGPIPYSYSSRFEQDLPAGTSPEELVGAALASCYSMYLSALIGKKGCKVEEVLTSADVSLVEGPMIGGIKLRVEVKLGEGSATLEESDFMALAKEASAECPIAKALGAVDDISIDATLVL